MTDNRIDPNSLTWSRLSEDDRFEITQAARDRFAHVFGDLPDVNWIGNSCERICVQTKLPYGQSLEALPETFEEFPVAQQGVREAMDRFIATWKAALTRIACWSPEQTSEWASDEHHHFKSGFFLHDSPMSIVARELMPKELRNNQAAKVAVCEAVSAQRTQDLWHPDQDPEYDWDAAFSRVQAAIANLKNTRK